MEDKSKYFLVKKRAMPDVLLQVIEAKKLLESHKVDTVQEAVERVGISRSSYYKYKDDVFPFHDTTKGKTFTMVTQIEDEPGILAELLQIIADYKANILTIHQSIPVNGMATITFSVEVLPVTGDISAMIAQMEEKNGVQDVKIIARE